MPKISFYDQVGILVPGAVLLFGLLFFFPALRETIAGQNIDLGGLGVFLIMSYAAGHLVGAVGNLLEIIFWLPFGGMPSNLPIGQKPRLLNAGQITSLQEGIHQRLGLEAPALAGMKPKQWNPYFQYLYRDVLTNSPGRSETFNGNYGLNRGLAAALLTLALLALALDPASRQVPLGLASLGIVFLFRMYLYGVHFAREVLTQFLLLAGGQINGAQDGAEGPKSN